MDLRKRRPNPGGPWAGAPAPPHPFLRRLLIVSAAVLLIIVAVLAVVPPALIRSQAWPYAARGGLILLFLMVWMAASRRRLSLLARDIALWAALALLLVAGYEYRFEVRALGDRLAGALLPTRVRSLGHGVVSVGRGPDGQFRLDAEVDGQPVRFLVDTGASGVVLTQADAMRLGFDPAKLDYSETFETANGSTRGAPIRLREVAIGPLRFDDVPASVNEGELQESLLGMRLLERLTGIEIRNDTLTIRQ